MAEEKVNNIVREAKPPITFDELRVSYNNFKSVYHPYLDKMYERFFMINPSRDYMLQKEDELWRSNIVSPFTYMNTTILYDMVKDAGVDIFVGYTDTDLSSVPEEERQAAIEKRKILKEELLDIVQFSIASTDSMAETYDSLFDTILNGWGIFSDSYTNVKNRIPYTKIENNKIVEGYITEQVDCSSWRYVSPYNLFFIGGKNKKSIRFFIERKILTLDQIKAYYGRGYKITHTKKGRDNNASNDGYIDSIDHESKKLTMPFYLYYKNGIGTDDNLAGYDFVSDGSFNIKNKYVECFEITDKYFIHIFIDGEFKGSFPKKTSIGEHSYRIMNFKKVSGMIFSPGVGHIVSPAQTAYDEILNTRIDNVRLTMNKSFMVSTRLSMFNNKKTFKLSPGKVIQVSDVSEQMIREIEISPVAQSAYQETGELFQMITGITRVGSMVHGMQQKVERTARSADAIINAADSQVKQVLESFQVEFSKAIKAMILHAKLYMSKSQMEKILGKDSEFSKVDANDLMNNFIFEFNFNGDGTSGKAIRVQQLLQAIELTSNTKDSLGGPVGNVKPLYDKLMQEMGVTEDVGLSEDQIAALAKNLVTIQSAIQQAQATQTSGREGIVDGSTVSMNPGQGITDKYKVTGPGAPLEMTPNPNGANQFSS